MCSGSLVQRIASKRSHPVAAEHPVARFAAGRLRDGGVVGNRRSACDAKEPAVVAMFEMRRGRGTAGFGKDGVTGDDFVRAR